MPAEVSREDWEACRDAITLAGLELAKAEAKARAGVDYSAPLGECNKLIAKANKLIEKMGGKVEE